MNRLLLLALTAELLSPIAAKAEGEFTELTPINPYSYQTTSVSRWWKEGKRYIFFKGTTKLPSCFNDSGKNECIPSWWRRAFKNNKIMINMNNQLIWSYQIDCDKNTFNRDGDWQNWINVRLDPTAQTVLNKYCPLNSWNKLPLDTTK